MRHGGRTGWRAAGWPKQPRSGTVGIPAAPCTDAADGRGLPLSSRGEDSAVNKASLSAGWLCESIASIYLPFGNLLVLVILGTVCFGSSACSCVRVSAFV